MIYTLFAEEFNAVGSSYEWFNSNTVLIGNQASVVVFTSGNYKLVLAKNGCSTEKTINVIAPFCRIQKGISPNNDGFNDSLDLSSFNVDDIKIFNRYGRIAYDKTSYQKEWFGQFNNGEELPDGTY